MLRKVTVLAALLLPAVFAGCFRAAPSTDFPEAKRLPGGFNALEAVGDSAGFHIVGPGETLYSIAGQYKVSVKALKDANAITDEHLVRAGARLRIPDAGTAPAAPIPAAKPEPDKTAPLSFERRYIRPCRGRTVLRFGEETRGASSGHIEIMAAEGTAVAAARSGTVILASEEFPGMGRVVMLQHEKGNSTLYGRLSRIDVKQGSIVRQGEKLGTAGGRPVVFQLSIGGDVKDPEKYFGP